MAISGIEILKEASKKHGLSKIAIIDDVFDVPDPNSFDQNEYGDFLDDWEDNVELSEEVQRVARSSVEDLPDYADLPDEAEKIRPLWESVCKASLSAHTMRAAIADRLKVPFKGHAHDPLSMLDKVSSVYSFFRKELDCTVITAGTDISEKASDLAKCDLVVLDFFLVPGDSVEASLGKLKDIVAQICVAAEERGGANPSFLMMSSRPTDAEPEQLRENAKLMKARFRFIPKDDLVLADGAELLGVHDVVESFNRISQVELLVNDWVKATQKTAEDIHKDFLNFDIADYVYLDAFRLYSEGVSVPSYLQWLMSALLEAKIPRYLDSSLWQSNSSMRLFEVDGKGAHSGSLLNTFKGLTSPVAHAYGDIVLDETRGEGPGAVLGVPANDDYVEGDLFIKANRNALKLDGKEVRMILTPTCDLIVRGGEKKPRAKTVVFLPGVLKKIKVDPQKSLSQTSYIQVRHINQSKKASEKEPDLFEIQWDYKAVTAVDWEDLVGRGKPEKGFMRLGRIREPQFYSIRDSYAQSLTRIGREVAPPLPSAEAVTVFCGVNNNKEKIASADVSQGYAWTLAASGKKIVHFDRTLFGDIEEEIVKSGLDVNFKTQVIDILKDFDTVYDLAQPKEFGARGPGEFCQVVDASKENEVAKKLKSNSKLVIIVGDYED